MTTVITECKVCKPNKFQDETYGKNQRVHNLMKKEVGKTQKARCTVCKNEKEVENN